MRVSLIFLLAVAVLVIAAKKPKTLKERAKREVGKAAKYVEDKSRGVQEHFRPDEPTDEFVPHEELVHQEDQYGEPKKIVKPKSLKVLSAYEQCKLECKKQRDQENAQEYVERLRDELRQAEELIANQKTHESESL
ncbi:unnamed protein product [Bursaphelenchus okinawaensis]|uniref:Uncharacterized protein n=1 Tax=Bursaphelenchus okinawaensis TaxID=465554 RepID=A0A811K6Z5_9BILA|nr:unnamed protein product [Bursaphelenchus okinawaensis]CAG9092795.1 unnamed protein product [Bursaphelenchus okinawaensis]